MSYEFVDLIAYLPGFVFVAYLLVAGKFRDTMDDESDNADWIAAFWPITIPFTLFQGKKQ